MKLPTARICPLSFVIAATFALTNSIFAANDFETHIAPILQQQCLSCHNDEEKKGDFSLQSAASAFADGYIEKNNSAQSHLVDVITAVDGTAKMPQNADPLSTKQVAAIRKWIDAGAVWPADFVLKEPAVTNFDWWSYKPVRSPRVPEPADLPDGWTSPIDRFVFAKMKEKGLSPYMVADRRTLLRRVTYDLTGLPPTPQQLLEFVTDTDPKAYEKVVDRLLKSKHYGERWARHWLDVVKYADTCGYDKDKLRPNAWPYRDYVIRSFNDDKPYSRFVQEQIAGDVLFPGEPDGIVGLGFIAAGPWDFIGHVEVPESKIDGKVARNLDRDDMVSNAMNTFCSVTVQCARCHNHKFDPITQENYYGLQSIFAAVDKADRTYDIDPAIEKQRSELQQAIKVTESDLAKLTKEISDAGGKELAALNHLIKQLQPKVKVIKSAEFGYHSATSKNADNEKWVEVELPKSAVASRIVLNPCHDEFNNINAGFGFPVRFKVEIGSGDGQLKVIHDVTVKDIPNPGLTAYEIEVGNNDVRKVRVTATKLMARSNDFNFALAEIQVIDGNGVNVALNAKVTAKDSIEAPVRWRRSNLTDGLWAKPGDVKAAAQLDNASKQKTAILTRIETPDRIKRRTNLKTKLGESRQTIKSLPTGKPVYAATTNFSAQGNFKPTKGKLRPIHVLHRGNIQQPGPVAPIGVLPLNDSEDWKLASTDDEGQRRAELAKWLTSKNHPMVWRSIVNRVWQYHFGQGIVATPNDFGRMGAKPTHPELLDWLATQFRDSGQSLKALHRMIVTSAVYRQSNLPRESSKRIDGSNQYLSRMNSRRLSAEEIRDSILFISGKLNPKMGGPGFYLFKLEKATHSPHYEYHKFDPTDEASYRRSIYRFIVRSQPDPWMTTLDCADSSQSTPRRNETLTSLQALSMLNNKFILVMAKHMAARAGKYSDKRTEQVRFAFGTIVQREPEQVELTELMTYTKQHGLENTCRFLFNLTEFVFVN